MSDGDALEVLRELEELLLRESIDNSDPETIAMIEEVSAEVSAIKQRITS